MRQQKQDMKLRIDQLPVGAAEALLFVFFANIGFDDAGAGHILLQDAVNPVELVLQNGKAGVDSGQKKYHAKQQDREGAGSHDAEADVQRQKKEDAARKKHEAADKAADTLGHQVFQLGHVIGHAGDQGAGGKLVGLLKRKRQDAAKDRLAQVVAEILAAQIGKDAAEYTAEAAGHDQTDHLQAGGKHQAQIAGIVVGQSQNALVDDDAHQARLQQIYGNFTDHE